MPGLMCDDDEDDYREANRRFCHKFQRNCCNNGNRCIFIHGTPTAADVAEEAERRHRLRRQDPTGRSLLRPQTTPTAARSHRGQSAPVSAGGGAGFGRGSRITDAPTALERGDTMWDLIVDGGDSFGLLTPGVLGTPEDVCKGLSGAFVLQHPLLETRGGVHLKPRGGAEVFNETTPATVFHLGQNSSELIGGGIEAGLMPMGAAAGQAGGLRPGVMDTRGDDWNLGAVRGLTSESPAAHEANDCPHFFAKTNWMMKKKGAPWHEKMKHLMLMLVTVATWMSVGRSCVAHCNYSPLISSPEVCCYYLF